MENETKLEGKQYGFDDEQVKLIRSLIAPQANENEFKLFLYYCQKTQLDPLARQIYCVHRKVGDAYKMVIQTSIDGFRVIAERHGDYAGQDEPVFGEYVDLTYTEYNKTQSISVPEYAKVTVYRLLKNGQRVPFATGVAYWWEYYPGQKVGAMWHKMPHNQLAKCAEALALRKAFPQDLSGLYTNDEMEQAGNEATTDISIVPKSSENGKSESGETKWQDERYDKPQQLPEVDENRIITKTEKKVFTKLKF